MSVVLAYADDKIAVLASDGRVVDGNNNILKENYSKIRRINSKTIIGFAGELLPCENIANILTNPLHTDLIESLYVEDIVPIIQKLLIPAPEHIRVGFIICGIDRKNQICLSHILNHQEPVFQHPSRCEPCYEGLYPEEINRNCDVFGDNLKKYYPNILPAINSTISYCAQNSPSVNDTIYLETLCAAQE